MPNSFLKGKIRNYDFYKSLAIFILVFASFVEGKFFVLSNSWRTLVAGGLTGGLGVVILFLIEYFFEKQSFYQKGYDFELKLEKKLEELRYHFEPHVETPFGDLDFYVEKKIVDGKSASYGVEAKDWSGTVTFENNLLKVKNCDCTYILTKLLGHCALVRDQKFGSNSKIFIKPVLIFGYNATIKNIPGNIVRFNNVDIVIATIQDFDKFL